MIEMTREEALKIVRENYPHFGTTEPWLDLEKALATLVPELRESEDERIRKWIASYIHHGVFTEDEHPMALKAVEWLEKQKEPENVSATTMAPSCWEVKQKEQKPADRFEEAKEKYQVEWSEEDESKMGVIIRLVEQNSGWPYRAIKEYVYWLKSLRPVSKESLQSHWKPSEEQMEVDLDKEIEEYWVATGWSKVITLGKFKVIARYFCGLGQLNSK